MTYNFSSNASEAILAVQDGNGLLSASSVDSGQPLPYSICGPTNCTQPRTISLNADYGVYYINYTGSPTDSSWGAVSYTLFGANHTGAHVFIASACASMCHSWTVYRVEHALAPMFQLHCTAYLLGITQYTQALQQIAVKTSWLTKGMGVRL